MLVSGRLQKEVYDLDDEKSFAGFARGEAVEVLVPGTNRKVGYDPCKRIGVTFQQARSQPLDRYGCLCFCVKPSI